MEIEERFQQRVELIGFGIGGRGGDPVRVAGALELGIERDADGVVEESAIHGDLQGGGIPPTLLL